MSRAKVIVVGSRLRRLHRWVSIAFTATVIANFVARAQGTPPAWVTYSPLIPLAMLVLTGLYLFVLPYTVKRPAGAGDDAAVGADQASLETP